LAWELTSREAAIGTRWVRKAVDCSQPSTIPWQTKLHHRVGGHPGLRGR
jgi:hypothetical protein